MKNSINRPIKTLALASALALIGTFLCYDCLFQGAPLGANVPFFFLLFYAAVFFLFRQKANLLRHQNFLLLALSFAFSLTFALYNNAFLLFLNACALFCCTALQLNLMLGLETFLPYSAGSLQNIFYTLFVRPFHKIGRALSPEKGERKAFLPILLAILTLIPILGLLLALLASADQVFSQILGRIFRIDSIIDLLLWALTFLAGATLLASLFTSLLTVRQQQSPQRQKVPAKFNLTAAIVVLMGVALLMVAFSLVQGFFLFGSAQLPAGLSYSEYARQGFFQLCAAAVFVFGLVSLCRTCTRHAQGGQKVFLNALYTLLLLCTLMLIASSFYRLALYERAFSFTRMRIYVQAFLILLGLICLYSIAHTWRPWQSIGQIVAVTTLCALLGLSYFNVDAFIARKNVVRLDKTMSETGEYGDLDYLLNLSIDALPYYLSEIEASDLMPEEDLFSGQGLTMNEYWARNSLRQKRCHRLNMLLEQAEGRYSSDLRYWNLGRNIPSHRLDALKGLMSRATAAHHNSW